ncbi:MAG: 2-aminoethylphosphonate aminotransferase [Gammaproteobacteria bacterium]|nr:2-aminoethylphosphonate aminotransferase [Gammaproteobacteria bacterium]
MNLLLNPGPVTLSTRVRQALLRPDLCHREPEFSELQTGIRTELLKVYGLKPSQWSAILLTGSGTAAVEAMLTSLVPADGRILIIDNGVYGARMAKMAAAYSIEHDTVTASWGEPVDNRMVEEQLKTGNYSHIAIVHHETTTGRLNDLAAIGRLAELCQAEMLIDAVSSFGAEAIDFDNWPVAGCAATANKCLHGVPGVSFVITHREALERGTSRSVYLDLETYEQQQIAGGTPFTQSVQCCYALAEALAEFFEEGGWQSRRDHYRRRMALVREGFEQQGIEPLLPADASSCVLNAFRLPAGMEYARLHDALKTAGFIIYAGQGELASTIFRIAVMGAVSESDLQRLVEEVGRLVKRKT